VYNISYYSCISLNDLCKNFFQRYKTFVFSLTLDCLALRSATPSCHGEAKLRVRGYGRQTVESSNFFLFFPRKFGPRRIPRSFYFDHGGGGGGGGEPTKKRPSREYIRWRRSGTDGAKGHAWRDKVRLDVTTAAHPFTSDRPPLRRIAGQIIRE